jgi:hypothetical protein
VECVCAICHHPGKDCQLYLEEERRKRNETYHKDAHDQVDDREDETAVDVAGASDIVGHD